MRRLRARLHDRDGSALVETITMLPVLVLAAFIAIQLQLFVSTASDAENAARSASRAVRNGDDAFAAARNALSGAPRASLSPSDVRVHGERVTVRLEVPIVVQSIRPGVLDVTRSAQLPRRS
ncbi:TadE/TadG family type IV pilus assembly protein [Nitriliruptor alkaliphilus]|uniref:TadE/TadG family type IV pilus assembly protein n=1 Tax=Nitriliruptor alkaliphilus TaxID=427918 RepID=UPI0006988291|nr:TadE/TadG family type IV pilus assembly protein [Nitriliruptor alkaliphilus]